MTKVQSGAILIGVAIVINLIGRALIGVVKRGNSVTMATLLGLLMVASIVIALFGLFRLIMGMKDKN